MNFCNFIAQLTQCLHGCGQYELRKLFSDLKPYVC